MCVPMLLPRPVPLMSSLRSFAKQALLAIPPYPNIIPLYDSFLLPESKELYFVFEPMKGTFISTLVTVVALLLVVSSL